jgi:hydrogenase maturation factor HypF (carbamoyltransferase family)
MEISVLQSLIDRTSNQIAELEGCVATEKDALRFAIGYERENHKYALEYYKRRLPKLREIQKVLKKEIANKIKFQRFRLKYSKEAALRRKETAEKWAAEDMNNANNP